MKVCLILTVAAFGAVCGDEAARPTSTYAVLPYATHLSAAHRGHAPASHQATPAHNNNNYQQQQHYYDDSHYENDKNKNQRYTLNRLMKAPFKALMGMFDGAKSRFDDARLKILQLNGSLLKTKGYVLQTSGENILRNAYKNAAKGNYYPIEPYTLPALSSSSHLYHHPPAYTVQSGPAPVAYKDIATNGERPYHDRDHDHDHEHVTNNLGASFSNSITPHGHDGLSGRSSHAPFLHGGTAYSSGRRSGFAAPLSFPYSLEPQTQTRRGRQFSAEGRSGRSFGGSWRTQRSYPVNPIMGHGPIPVPVPIPVFPSRLIFPSIQDMAPLGGGYH